MQLEPGGQTCVTTEERLFRFLGSIRFSSNFEFFV